MGRVTSVDGPETERRTSEKGSRNRRVGERGKGRAGAGDWSEVEISTEGRNK